MTRVPIFQVALLLALVSATVAQAVEVEVLDRGDAAIITVKGFFDFGDDVRFTYATAGISKAIVYFESPGGRILPAMNLGFNIWKRGFETAVAPGTVCSSACALSWLGGNPRRMGEGARIGFHSAQHVKDGSSSAVGNEAIGSYIHHKLGIPREAVIFATKAMPNDMAWLNAQDAQTYNIHYNALTKAQADRYREALDRADPVCGRGRLSNAFDPCPQRVPPQASVLHIDN